MFTFKSIDKKFKDIGFTKIKEDKYGVIYERYDEEYEYIQKLDISHKINGKYLVQSYDATNTTSEFSPVVGLTEYEIKLVSMKIKIYRDVSVC